MVSRNSAPVAEQSSVERRARDTEACRVRTQQAIAQTPFGIRRVQVQEERDNQMLTQKLEKQVGQAQHPLVSTPTSSSSSSAPSVGLGARSRPESEGGSVPKTPIRSIWTPRSRHSESVQR